MAAPKKKVRTRRRERKNIERGAVHIVQAIRSKDIFTDYFFHHDTSQKIRTS